MVITKGDLLHQETKVARSGLAELFWRVEIVSEKDEATYRGSSSGTASTPPLRHGRQLRAQRRAPVLASAAERSRALLGDLGPRARRARPRAARLPRAHPLAELPACIESMARRG